MCLAAKNPTNQHPQTTLLPTRVVNFDTNGRRGHQVLRFDLASWCQETKISVKSGDDMIYPTMHGFNLNPVHGILKMAMVPLWSETLDPKWVEIAEEMGSSVRQAFVLEEVTRNAHTPAAEGEASHKQAASTGNGSDLERGSDPEGDDGQDPENADAET
jgi:hypothetical protein